MKLPCPSCADYRPRVETRASCPPRCPGRRARFGDRRRLQVQGERRAHSLPRKRGAGSPDHEVLPPVEDAAQVVAERSGLLTSGSLSLRRPSDLPAEPIRKYASSVTTTTSSSGRWLSAARNRA